MNQPAISNIVAAAYVATTADFIGFFWFAVVIIILRNFFKAAQAAVLAAACARVRKIIKSSQNRNTFYFIHFNTKFIICQGQYKNFVSAPLYVYNRYETKMIKKE